MCSKEKYFKEYKALLRIYISLPVTLWSCIGSLDMLGYEETKSPRSCQEAVLFKSLLDLSCPWGVSRQNVKNKIKRWTTSIWQCGMVLIVLRDRLEN